MASVFLNFVPPNDVPDLVSLLIYEAPDQAGPFNQIETVTAIGSPGAYITSYTTDQAVNENDWFAIQWENSKGAFSTMSSAIQGGTTSVVSEIVDRVLLRDPTLKEQVVAQEAAGVVESYCGTLTPDPATLTYNQMSGLTLLTMARCYVVRVASGTGTAQSWTAGLLVEKQATTAAAQSMKTIEDLIRLANVWLGRTYTMIALMKEIPVAGNSVSMLTGVDISRSIFELGVGPIPPPWPTMAQPTDAQPEEDGVVQIFYEFSFDTSGVLGEGAIWFIPQPDHWYEIMTFSVLEVFNGADGASIPFAKAYLYQQGSTMETSALWTVQISDVITTAGDSTVTSPSGWDNTPRFFSDDKPLLVALRDYDGNPLVNCTQGRARIIGRVYSTQPPAPVMP